MTVYRLLWELIKHVLHGRGRDEVHVAVDWDDTPSGDGSVTGSITEFRWESDKDAFCMLEARSEEGPWLR